MEHWIAIKAVLCSRSHATKYMHHLLGQWLEALWELGSITSYATDSDIEQIALPVFASVSLSV